MGLHCGIDPPFGTASWRKKIWFRAEERASIFLFWDFLSACRPLLRDISCIWTWGWFDPCVQGNGRGRWMDQHSCTSWTLIIDWQAIYRCRTNHTGILAKACLRGKVTAVGFSTGWHTLWFETYMVHYIYLLVSELYCAFGSLIQTV